MLTDFVRLDFVPVDVFVPLPVFVPIYVSCPSTSRALEYLRALRVCFRDDQMLSELPDGVVISVRVIPRAGRSGIAGTRDGAVLVRLHAPPVDGAANAELIEVIADALDVPKSVVTIESGTTSKQKRVKVSGITVDRAARRLPH